MPWRSSSPGYLIVSENKPALNTPSVLLMQAHLPVPVAQALPAGFELVAFSEAAHARPARALLNAVYADGGGDVLAFEDWWPALSADEEFDPMLCLPVIESETGLLAAFAQCWSSGFIKDIGVRPDLRRQGLGRALMAEIFAVFPARGIDTVRLKVHANNPSGAVAFYKALGMQQVHGA